MNGLDVYSVMVVEVFGVSFEEVISDMCCKVKVVNFGLIYGMLVFGLLC